MINKKKIGALILTGAMMLSIGTTAFAAENNDTPDVNSNGQVNITKDFEMAEGLSIPESGFTFNFEVTSAKGNPEGTPTATITPITYKDTDRTDKNLKDGKYTLSKNTAISFSGDWPHAGEYVYNVKETNGAVTDVTYSTSEYILRVYVKNTEKGLAIEKITAQLGKDGAKTDKILFTNTYRKKDSSLTIVKNTIGEYADKTKKFNFTINFTKSPTEDILGDITGTITRKSGEPKTEKVTVNNGTANFTLADGDQLVFDKLPVGTTYTVTEKGAKDGYLPSVKVTENGVEDNKYQSIVNDESSLSAENKLVGEKKNEVTFVNSYKDIAITGIFTNNAPFIVLIGVAVVGLAALTILKRRKTAER